MPRHIILLLAILLSGESFGQLRLSLIIKNLPSYHRPDDSIFVTGSFCGWDPALPSMRLRPRDGKPGITIELPKGMFEYKFTRGDWDRVESSKKGTPTQNRNIQLESDTTVEVSIEHWADHFPKQPKQSTASPNVHVIDTAFFIPQLQRPRRIWIYLPPNYASSADRYRVIYLQDGQNVFDQASAAYGEWGVDEAMDSLGEQAGYCILVAVDNGGERRINEYAPYDMERFGRGEGKEYVDFLAHTLKPFIDAGYRTLPQPENTYVAGSSMGGLISLYAMLRHPSVFGGAGIFSPAFWVNPQIRDIDARKARNLNGRLYFYAGEQESDQMVPDMLAVADSLRQHSGARIETVIRPEGRHDEASWRTEWENFYRWVMR